MPGLASEDSYERYDAWPLADPPFLANGAQDPATASWRRDITTAWALNDLLSSREFTQWVRRRAQRGTLVTLQRWLSLAWVALALVSLLPPSLVPNSMPRLVVPILQSPSTTGSAMDAVCSRWSQPKFLANLFCRASITSPPLHYKIDSVDMNVSLYPDPTAHNGPISFSSTTEGLLMPREAGLVEATLDLPSAPDVAPVPPGPDAGNTAIADSPTAPPPAPAPCKANTQISLSDAVTEPWNLGALQAWPDQALLSASHVAALLATSAQMADTQFPPRQPICLPQEPYISLVKQLVVQQQGAVGCPTAATPPTILSQPHTAVQPGASPDDANLPDIAHMMGHLPPAAVGPTFSYLVIASLMLLQIAVFMWLHLLPPSSSVPLQPAAAPPSPALAGRATGQASKALALLLAPAKPFIPRYLTAKYCEEAEGRQPETPAQPSRDTKLAALTATQSHGPRPADLTTPMATLVQQSQSPVPNSSSMASLSTSAPHR